MFFQLGYQRDTEVTELLKDAVGTEMPVTSPGWNDWRQDQHWTPQSIN
jgi:hypothetical protein